MGGVVLGAAPSMLDVVGSGRLRRRVRAGISAVGGLRLNQKG